MSLTENQSSKGLEELTLRKLSWTGVKALTVAATVWFVFANEMLSFLIEGPEEGLASSLFVGFGFLLVTVLSSLFFTLYYDIQDTNIVELSRILYNHGRNGFLVMIGFTVILAPLIEELLFRVVPYALMIAIGYLFGWTGFSWLFTGIIAFTATAIWLSAHGKRAVVLLPQGVFYLMLLYNGLLIEALVAHSVMNFICVCSSIAGWKIDQYRNNNVYDAEPAPDDAPALPEPTLKEKLLYKFNIDI